MLAADGPPRQSAYQTPPLPQQQHSADDTTRDRKRSRRTFACHICHRRKLKCDRVYPACGRCVKSGIADSCTYDPRVIEGTAGGDVSEPESEQHEGSTQHSQNVQAIVSPSRESAVGPALSHFRTVAPTPTGTPGMIFTEDVSMQVQIHERRISELEERLAMAEQRTRVSSERTTPTGGQIPSTSATPRDLGEYPEMSFGGNSFQTRYNGASNSAAPIYQFPELSAFAKPAMYNNRTLSRLRYHLKLLHTERHVEPMVGNFSTDEDLLTLLPTAEVVTRSAKMYFETIEKIYRVLHAPTFWKELGTFWANAGKARPGFIAVLLLVLATVACFPPDEPIRYHGGDAPGRELALQWIRACEDWLRHQSQKHATREMFEVQCLLLIAKRVNIVKQKQAWTQSGTALRVAMAAGLHREPSLLNSKITVFDQEMRRRMWATLLELDLQASLDRGMPSATLGIPSDCNPPGNLDDDDFDELTKQLPRPRQDYEYQATSFLHLSQRSRALRMKLTSMVNDTTTPLNYDDVLQYDKRIYDELAILSKWAEAQIVATPYLPFIAMDIHLRHFILLLHGPFAKRSEANRRYAYSRVACLNAGSSILENYSRIQFHSGLSLGLLSNAVLRAGLSISQIVATAVIRNDMFSRAWAEPFLTLVEKTIHVFEELILRHGKGIKQYWYLCATYGFAVAISQGRDVDEERQKAIDKLTNVCYKVLASHGETPDPSAIFGGHLEPTGVDLPIATMADLTGPGVTGAGGAPDFPTFDFPEHMDWTLDSLWTLDFNELSF